MVLELDREFAGAGKDIGSLHNWIVVRLLRFAAGGDRGGHSEGEQGSKKQGHEAAHEGVLRVDGAVSPVARPGAGGGHWASPGVEASRRLRGP